MKGEALMTPHWRRDHWSLLVVSHVAHAHISSCQVNPSYLKLCVKQSSG